MSAASLAAKLNVLFAQESLSPTELASVHAGPPQVATTPVQVSAALEAFQAQQGWLCLTDRVVHFADPASRPALEGVIVLYGELVNGAETLVLRQDESGWVLRRITRHEGSDCLVVRHRFVPVPPVKRSDSRRAGRADGTASSTQSARRIRWIDYETYWMIPEARTTTADNGASFAASEPYISRFAGFDAFDNRGTGT